MKTSTKLVLAALGAWLYFRVRATTSLQARREFPAKGAADPDSIHPDHEDRAMVDRFRDASGILL